MFRRCFEDVVALPFDQGIGRIPAHLVAVAAGAHEAVHLGPLGPSRHHHGAFGGLHRTGGLGAARSTRGQGPGQTAQAGQRDQRKHGGQRPQQGVNGAACAQSHGLGPTGRRGPRYRLSSVGSRGAALAGGRTTAWWQEQFHHHRHHQQHGDQAHRMQGSDGCPHTKFRPHQAHATDSTGCRAE